MKNAYFPTLLFLIAFANLSLFAAQADTVKAPNISTPPVFDGVADDGCWQNAEWQPIDEVWITWGVPVPEDDYSGRYKMVWSSETNLLYFFVEVHDDIAVDGFRNGETAGTFNFDIIEVFIDEDKSGGLHVFDGSGNTGRDWGTNAENAFSYHIYADIPVDGETSPLAHVSDTDGADWGDRFDPNYIDHVPDFALRKDGNRYTREFSLKVYDDSYENHRAEAARVQLAPGKILGLSVAVCDNDDVNENPAERDHFFGSVWVPEAEYNDHWKNADGYGAVLLAGTPTTVGKAESPVQMPDMFVYPNPVKNQFRLNLINDATGRVDLKIYNLLGQEVYSGAAQKRTFTFQTRIDIGHLQNGVYFLQTRLGAHQRMLKIIKQ